MRARTEALPPSIKIQAIIMSELLGRRRNSVVSANRLIMKIRAEYPDCQIDDGQLAGSIKETALMLELIPVYARPRESGSGKQEDIASSQANGAGE